MRRCSYLAPLLLAASFPGLAAAEIQVDTNAAPNQQATVLVAPSGVPVINIAAPDSKGLSRNQFSLFNVDQPGAVFNNSLTGGRSQLAGNLDANPNLSQRALVILTEVTGNQPSSLAGTLEVFGGKADLIVANPNGITLNGVSTRNVHGFVASTGRAELADGLYLRQEDGNGRVLVGEQGVDTQGLSYFDIVARVVTLNGRIGAPGSDADVQLITGLNRYDSKQRTANVLASNAANTPSVAIEGSVAGAMYGRNITLISSENSVGVRTAGLIQAAQDIQVQANGDIDLARAKAGQRITLSSASKVLLNGSAAGSGIQAGGTLQITAGDSISLNADVLSSRFIAQAKTLQINAANLTTSSTDASAPALSIQVDDFILNGTLQAYDSLFGGLLGRDQPLLMKNGRLQVARRPGQYDEYFKLTSNANITSAGGIVINAKRFSNNQGAIVDSSARGIQISAGTLNNLGIVRSAGDMRVNAGQLNNLCTDALAIQSLCGGLFSDAAATIVATTLNNQAGLTAQTDLSLLLGNGPHSNAETASISAGRDLLIRPSEGAISQLLNAGELLAKRNLQVTLDGLSNSLTGSLTTFGNLDLDIAATFTSAGRLASAGLLDIVAQDLRFNSGSQVVSLGNATLSARNSWISEERSLIHSQADLNINAENNLNTAGDISSRGNLLMSSLGALTNTGTIIADQDMEMRSGSTLLNDNGGLIYAGNNLKITSAANMTNSNQSMMASGQDATFDVTGTFLNDQGATIEAGNELMIRAQIMRNRHDSLIHGVDHLNIVVGNYQDTSEGSILMVNYRVIVKADMEEKGD
ncbi:filamentous hemagglutinin N-terminal domain-containing protein [Pseudomonas sp. TE3786]